MGLMSFFDSKEDVETAEEELVQKLFNVPLIDVIIENILGLERPWVRTSQSYYDNCRRYVIVEPDALIIKWSSIYNEPCIGDDGKKYMKEVEHIHDSVEYHFTDAGYLPLHSYRSDNNKIEIQENRVCIIFASIIRERLAAKMSDCSFNDVNKNATFTYCVPKLTFKDWF